MNTDAFLARLLEEGIKPYAEKLARILLTGDIAVVVFEPHASSRPAMRALGWDGKSAVFAMPNNIRKRLAKNIDAVTSAWLTNGNVGRIFVCVHFGTLLVNFVEELGFSIEPGSLDAPIQEQQLN